MRRSQNLHAERLHLLRHWTQMTDKVMVVLAFVWIGLMIADFLGKLGPATLVANYIIWGIFIADFAVKLVVAPVKLQFLRENWLTVLSLVLPAFRVLRIFQALNSLRALTLVRMLTSFNRGMGALVSAMGRRGAGYVFALTIIVLFSGAAGMYYFENPAQLRAQGFVNVADSGGGLHSYADAVWWTAMLMTTIGSQYWPVTTAGRVLCFMVSLFSLGVFGYITATLASFFVDTDKKPAHAEDVSTLKHEIALLRQDLRKKRMGSGATDGD